MAESFFDRLKKTVIEGASTAASKAESATRLGKLHLDKMSEERRLQDKEAQLGRLVYQLAGEGSLENLATQDGFLQAVGAIRLSEENILSIQETIDQEGDKAKADKADKAASKTSEDTTSKTEESEKIDEPKESEKIKEAETTSSKDS